MILKVNEIKIRSIKKVTVLALDEEANRQGISREALIRKILDQWAVDPEITAIHDRYNDLFKTFMSLASEMTKAIESLNIRK